MKKKLFVTIIVIVMAVFTAMLFGCGEKGSETAENGEAVSAGISEKKLKKADTISEFCSKGKHYICLVHDLNKDGKIHEMYFIEDGIVTVLPGDVYGCNVGDLAKMSDKDIWNKYEEVKKTYYEELKYVDLPAKYMIKTDASGNAPREEFICIPQNKEVVYSENGNPLYTGINIVHFDKERAGVGGEVQIYDKTFFYFDTTNWDYYITTEIIKMDDVKNKNCIVDPGAQVDEMFKDYFESK